MAVRLKEALCVCTHVWNATVESGCKFVFGLCRLDAGASLDEANLITTRQSSDDSTRGIQVLAFKHADRSCDFGGSGQCVVLYDQGIQSIAIALNEQHV